MTSSKQAARDTSPVRLVDKAVSGGLELSRPFMEAAEGRLDLYIDAGGLGLVGAASEEVAYDTEDPHKIQAGPYEPLSGYAKVHRCTALALAQAPDSTPPVELDAYMLEQRPPLPAVAFYVSRDSVTANEWEPRAAEETRLLIVAAALLKECIRQHDDDLHPGDAQKRLRPNPTGAIRRDATTSFVIECLQRAGSLDENEKPKPGIKVGLGASSVEKTLRPILDTLEDPRS